MSGVGVDYRERAVESLVGAAEASKRGDKELAKERTRVAVLAIVFAAVDEAEKRRKESADASGR